MKTRYSILITIISTMYFFPWFYINGQGEAFSRAGAEQTFYAITYFENEITLYYFLILYGLVLVVLSIVEKTKSDSEFKLKMNSIYLGTTALFLGLSIYQGMQMMKTVIEPTDITISRNLFWIRLDTIEPFTEYTSYSNYYNLLLPLTLVMLIIFWLIRTDLLKEKKVSTN